MNKQIIFNKYWMLDVYTSAVSLANHIKRLINIMFLRVEGKVDNSHIFGRLCVLLDRINK